MPCAAFTLSLQTAFYAMVNVLKNLRNRSPLSMFSILPFYLLSRSLGSMLTLSGKGRNIGFTDLSSTWCQD
jgi:hypothetical protein